MMAFCEGEREWCSLFENRIYTSKTINCSWKMSNCFAKLRYYFRFILMAVCLRKTAENSMKFSNCNLKVDNLKIHGLMEFW
jgi:hypothetical protein